MVQLTKDTLSTGRKLIKLKIALSKIQKNISYKTKTKNIFVNNALGHIVAEDIFARRNVPPHSNSAVDGYAIRFNDTKKNLERTFTITGKYKAGSYYKEALKIMCTVRVLTGATLPKGSDTVIMEEDCQVNGNKIILPKKIIKGINFRSLGEDIKIKDKVFSKGHKILPQDIGILSSLGLKKVKINIPLKINVFSSGDEIMNSHKKLDKGQLYDSNRPMIINLLLKIGCTVKDLGILPDNRKEILNNLISASKNCDLIISSGAMSLGDEDHIRDIIEKNGSLDIWKLAIKPGRPVGYGSFKNTPILALPGNPVAAFVTFLIIGIPLIKKMSGAKDINPTKYKLPVNFIYKKKPGRIEYLRVRTINKNGILMLEKFHKEGAGILTSTSWADGLAILDEDTIQLNYNDLVNYISFNEILS